MSRRDSQLLLGVIILFGNTSRVLCLLGVNYPPLRHYDATHIPAEYGLHSRFIPTDVAMSTQGKRNVAACFTVLGRDGKPWTMQVRRERRHGDAVCPLGEDIFVSASPPKIMV